jgi:hypothetical protein
MPNRNKLVPTRTVALLQRAGSLRQNLTMT